MGCECAQRSLGTYLQVQLEHQPLSAASEHPAMRTAEKPASAAFVVKLKHRATSCSKETLTPSWTAYTTRSANSSACTQACTAVPT
jgi:hypothetical protein